MIKITPFGWVGEASLFQRTASFFSPDGQFFCRSENFNDTHLYKFDRCSGEFSEGIILKIPNDSTYQMGVSFSPDNHFLYVSSNYNLYQFDMQSNDIFGSRIHIAKFDSLIFSQHHPAPDGKIYITSSNVPYIHVINDPNKRGKACNFVKQGLQMPVLGSFSLPFYPNFKLYDWPNSPCDTLDINKTNPKLSFIERDEIKLVPNPTSSEVKIILPEKYRTGKITVYSSTGLLMHQYEDISKTVKLQIDTYDWSSGVYFVVIDLPEISRVIKKLVVVH
jgi:hypothetical protein